MDPTPTGLFTDRREPATRIQRRKARVYRTLAIGKGVARERAAYSYICMPRFWMYYKPIFSLGEGFFLCATNNWKTTEVGIPYRMSGPFSHLPTASLSSTRTNRAHWWYCDKSVPSLSRNIDLSHLPACSYPARQDEMGISQQIRPDAPPWPAAMQKPMGS